MADTKNLTIGINANVTTAGVVYTFRSPVNAESNNGIDYPQHVVTITNLGVSGDGSGTEPLYVGINAYITGAALNTGHPATGATSVASKNASNFITISAATAKAIGYKLRPGKSVTFTAPPGVATGTSKYIYTLWAIPNANTVTVLGGNCMAL